MATRNDSRRVMRRLARGVLLLACLTLAACEDRREPVKPKVAATLPGAAATGA